MYPGLEILINNKLCKKTFSDVPISKSQLLVGKNHWGMGGLILSEIS